MKQLNYVMFYIFIDLYNVIYDMHVIFDCLYCLIYDNMYFGYTK